MALRASSLARGFSGLLACRNRNVVPIVPEMGIVGTSGDLTPPAHIALVLIGKGEAIVDGGWSVTGSETHRLLSELARGSGRLGASVRQFLELEQDTQYGVLIDRMLPQASYTARCPARLRRKTIIWSPRRRDRPEPAHRLRRSATASPG